MILRRLRKALALAWNDLRHPAGSLARSTWRRRIGAKYRASNGKRKRSQTAPTPGADE